MKIGDGITKTELIEFLKTNVRLDVNVHNVNDIYGPGIGVSVSLSVLDEEVHPTFGWVMIAEASGRS